MLADLSGVDLIIEEALTVRDEVGRVSEVTWSKVQSTGMTLARTQAYSLHQLDDIAEKLGRKSDLGEIATATKNAETELREWLAVLARTFQLEDAVAVIELDRVLDASPGELEAHRIGLNTARRNRKVLLNPFDAPAAVNASNRVVDSVSEFRKRIGIDVHHDVADAKRWGQALGEVRDKALGSASDSVAVARKLGSDAFDRANGAFRAVDTDGDGVPDKTRARAAAEEAGVAMKGASANVTDVLGTFLRRKHHAENGSENPDPETPAGAPGTP